MIFSNKPAWSPRIFHGSIAFGASLGEKHKSRFGISFNFVYLSGYEEFRTLFRLSKNSGNTSAFPSLLISVPKGHTMKAQGNALGQERQTTGKP